MLLVEKINSYSEFTEAANKALGEKLYQRTLEEGFVDEFKSLEELTNTFASINEKMCNKSVNDSKSEDEDDVDDEDDATDDDDDEDNDNEDDEDDEEDEDDE